MGLYNSGRTMRIAKTVHLMCTHELKTPFMAIIGYAEILKEKAMGSLDEEQVRLAEKIKHAGAQALQSLEQFLTLVHIQAVNTDEYCRQHHSSMRLTPLLIKGLMAQELEPNTKKLVQLSSLEEADLALPENYFRIIISELIYLMVQQDKGVQAVTITGACNEDKYELHLGCDSEIPNTSEMLAKIMNAAEGAPDYREGPGIGQTLAIHILHRFGGEAQIRKVNKRARNELVLILPLNNKLR